MSKSRAGKSKRIKPSQECYARYTWMGDGWMPRQTRRGGKKK